MRMRELDCEIVRDLLPNYIDELTSGYTNHAIEKHLESCEDCSEVYEKMQEDFLEDEEMEKERKKFHPPESVLLFLKKVKKKAFCKGAVIAAIVVGLIAGILGYNEYWQRFRVAVPIEAVEYEAYRMPDGGIAVTLTVPDEDKYKVSGWDCHREDGVHYFCAQMLYKPKLTNLLNAIFYPDVPSQNQWHYYFGKDELETTVLKIVYREGNYDYQKTHREIVLYDGTQELPLLDEMPVIYPWEYWGGGPYGEGAYDSITETISDTKADCN